MRKFFVPFLFLLAISLSVPALAQDKQDKNAQKRIAQAQKEMARASTKHKAIDLTGLVQAQGDKKLFLNDEDRQQWNIANPDMLRGHEGMRVKVKATPNSSDKSLLVDEVKDLKQSKAANEEKPQPPKHKKKKHALIF
jgi:hypothetical protein